MILDCKLFLIGEKRLGFLNVNMSASRVYFYVSMLGKLPNYKDGIALFNKVHLNIGGGFNMSTGVFKAPKAGIYQFSFSCLKDGYSFEAFFIHLRVNDVSTALSAVGAGHATLQVTQKLKKETVFICLNVVGCLVMKTKFLAITLLFFLLEEDFEEY